MKDLADHRAVTLSETVVVIAILALVSLLAYPAWTKARENTLMAQDVANLKQMGAAYLAYAADHKGLTPRAIRHDTGLPGPWFGSANTFGSPVRQLFSRYNPAWGAFAEGEADYLSSPDPLYSPFYLPTRKRQRGSFDTGGQYGYLFMYSPPYQPLVSGFMNDQLSRGARMPLMSDFFGPSYHPATYASSRLAVLYLDGGIKIFEQSELLNSRRDYTKRFRYLMER